MNHDLMMKPDSWLPSLDCEPRCAESQSRRVESRESRLLAHAFRCFLSPFLPLSLVSTPLAGAELISTPSKDISWVEQHFVDANLNNIEQYHYFLLMSLVEACIISK